MVAVLNEFVTDAGVTLTLPDRPTDRYSPNALARVTPKSNQGAALEAYEVWRMGTLGIAEQTRFSGILGGGAGWTGGTYLLFTDGVTDGYIWFTFNGAGADPTPGGTNFGQVDVRTIDTGVSVAAKLYAVLNSLTNTSIDAIESPGATQIDVTNNIRGSVTDATDGTLTGGVITVSVEVQGVDPDTTPWDGTFTDPIDGAQNLTYDDE